MVFPLLTLEFVPHPGALVARLTGQLDNYNAAPWQEAVLAEVRGQGTRLILDLEGLSYVSSMGFGAWIEVKKAIEAAGGQLILAGVDPRVRSTMDLLGFTGHFAVAETAAEALAADEAQGPAFPALCTCPICGRQARAPRPGRFRCGECRSVLEVAGAGMARLG